MILPKSFAVPVEPVQKPTEVVTSDKPFFDPAAGTSQMYAGVVTQPSEVIVTGASSVQATRDLAASMTATQPVEAAGTMRLATQPVEAPGATSEVLSQPTGTGIVDVRLVDQSLTSKKTVVAATTGVSDSEDDLHSEPYCC